MSADSLPLEGYWHSKLDSKLRLTLPAALAGKISESEEREFILTMGYGKNFVLRTKNSWNAFYNDVVAKLNYNNPTQRRLRMRYTLGLTEITADANWRISLPKKFCDQLGIQREVVLQGFGDLVEIWDQNAHDEQINSFNEDDLAALEDQFISSGQPDNT